GAGGDAQRGGASAGGRGGSEQGRRLAPLRHLPAGGLRSLLKSATDRQLNGPGDKGQLAIFCAKGYVEQQTEKHQPHGVLMHVCLFDIDGTLISSGGAGKSALERTLATEFGIDRPIEKLSLSGRTDRAIIRVLFQMHGLEESPQNWQRLRARYLRHLPACLADNQGRILPGISALLAQLAARDEVAVGLLTGNLRDGARLKLGH